MISKEWLIDNWLTVLSVSVYLLANVLPRPSGEQMNGPFGAFWRLLDKLCFLTSNRFPGNFKPIMVESPQIQALEVPSCPTTLPAGKIDVDSTVNATAEVSEDATVEIAVEAPAKPKRNRAKPKAKPKAKARTVAKGKGQET
jgi:hypothetical protein